MILAIDTSAGQCAVACDRVQRVERMDRGHAERLFPMIEAVLAEAGLGYADLSRIAVCTGPGSFTGIRVGVAAARGLALGASLPVIGVTRLEALAAAAARAARFTWQDGDLREVGADPAPSGPRPEPVIAVAIAARGGRYRQNFPDGGPEAGTPGEMRFEPADTPAPPGAIAVGDGWPAPGLMADGLVPLAHLAALAATRAPGLPPAPVYLRAPDAAPPREAPPPLLD